MERWLKCKVSPGQFSVEYAVRAEAFDGKGFSLFARVEAVDVERVPNEEVFETVDGRLRVELLSQTNGIALVRLPREAFEIGYFVTVRSDQLESSPAKQEVS